MPAPILLFKNPASQLKGMAQLPGSSRTENKLHVHGAEKVVLPKMTSPSSVLAPR